MMRVIPAVVVAFFVFSPPANGDNPPSAKPPHEAIRGIWLATLKVSPIELRLAVTIRANADGSLSATLNSLDQDAVEHKLDETSLTDRKLRIVLKGSNLSYEGVLSAAGTELSGQFKQSGVTLPLTFNKVQKLPEGSKRPQEPKRPYPYEEREVTFVNSAAHAKFTGTLTVPRTAGPFPAALLITGSGQEDRNETVFGHRPFLVLSDYLTRRGIAVLRVDDRGVGGSTGDVTHATSEDFASDAQAAIAFLKTQRKIDPRHVGLIGHSEGGIIAAIVAARSPEIAFIVLLAGTGLPGEQIAYLQMAAILKRAGLPDSVIAKSRTFQQALYAAAEQETDSAKLRTRIQHAIDEYGKLLSDEEKKQVGFAATSADKAARAVGSAWFRYYLTHDPRTDLRKVKCPVLALIGERDIQVPAEENLPEIEKALRFGGNRDATVKALPQLNHLFQTCQTGDVAEYSRIEETFAPSALKLVADWILQKTH